MPLSDRKMSRPSGNRDKREEKKKEMKTKKKMLTPFLSAILLIGLSYSRASAAQTILTTCGTFGAGSYIVANNITSAGISCLVFSAGPVTLDLNGFTLTSTSGVQNGVLAGAGIDSVTVRNGTIRGFTRGIALGGKGAVVDGVKVLDDQ